jgi:hypothetical protein
MRSPTASVSILALALYLLPASGCASSPAPGASPSAVAQDPRPYYSPDASASGLSMPGLKPFMRLAPWADASPSIQIPPEESVVRYEKQLDKVRQSGKVDEYVRYLRNRMKHNVDRFQERVDAVTDLATYVKNLDEKTWQEHRHDLALELRVRVGILRGMRARAAGQTWPPGGESGAPASPVAVSSGAPSAAPSTAP